jgi:thioredoxin-like negative regulator of GroEL
MRAPYKYPYLSIFILGYYFLEHEGYYYRIRSLFGYSETDDVSYVISMNQDNFNSMTKVPGRKSLIYFYKQIDQQHLIEFKKVAKKSKEKLRSPVVFGEVNCEYARDVCDKLNLPTFAFLVQGNVLDYYNGVVEKRKIVKFLNKNMGNPLPAVSLNPIS